jgi:hypothetical protein
MEKLHQSHKKAQNLEQSYFYSRQTYERKAMTTSTVTPNQAAQLYSEGKSVVEVAQALGITYGKARKLIAESGTDIRNTSDRLKGKTRKNK